MSSGRGRGRARFHYVEPLRKPGETRQEKEVESEEKPPVGTTVVSENEIVGKGQEQVEQDVSNQKQEENLSMTKEPVKKYHDILMKAVNTPEFVPKRFKEVGTVKPGPSPNLPASAILAPEFVPGQPFIRREETPPERIVLIKKFVSTKIKQVQDDPGLLEEISVSMSNYLSSSIKVDDDLRVLSDLLFEKCVSHLNFQYTGARLANYLDKSLKLEGISSDFRSVFLNRCKDENNKVDDMISTNPDEVPNIAIFLGELLMNYKTVDGLPIKKFRSVVSDMIKKLLSSTDRKLHICAGKLLKLTGSALDEDQEELFEIVKNMAADPKTDRTAQILFNRVCELRTMNWGKDETPTSSALPASSGETLPGASLYVPDISNCLEEQTDELPVYTEEQWNEFAIDGEDVQIDSEESFEELIKRISLENYGYIPFATADDSGTEPPEDDYYADYDSFLYSLR